MSKTSINAAGVLNGKGFDVFYIKPAKRYVIGKGTSIEGMVSGHPVSSFGPLFKYFERGSVGDLISGPEANIITARIECDKIGDMPSGKYYLGSLRITGCDIEEGDKVLADVYCFDVFEKLPSAVEQIGRSDDIDFSKGCLYRSNSYVEDLYLIEREGEEIDKENPLCILENPDWAKVLPKSTKGPYSTKRIKITRM